MTLTIQPMSADHAREMLNWLYPPPYAMYNLTADDLADEVAYLVDPAHHFYAILAEDDDFIGHCVFYDEARVCGGDYSADALDIGIGMRPDWTGQGRGSNLTAQVMQFGRERYQPQAFRATVAAWNTRAQQVCLSNGFVEVSRFQRESDGKAFVILQRDA